MFLQQSRNCCQEYRVEIDAEVPIVVWGRASALPLNAGTAIGNEVLHAKAKVTLPDGSEVTGATYEFFGHQPPMQCVLVAQLDPQAESFAGIFCMCGGSGQTRDRTVRVLEDANSQIKIACATRVAPGLVVLSPQGLESDQMMQSAIYGKLTVPLRLNEDKIEHGEMYHGRDGVFRDNKNTHISAAVHVRRNGAPTFFPNPYALHPISDDAPVFMGTERAKVSFI